MRILAVLFFLLAIASAVDAIHAQYSGVARESGYIPAPETHKQDSPTAFHGLVGYKWIRASLFFGGGFIFLQIAKTSRRLDPFSTDRS